MPDEKLAAKIAERKAQRDAKKTKKTKTDTKQGTKEEVPSEITQESTIIATDKQDNPCETASNQPVEVVEEESSESSTNVAGIVETPVTEAQEATELLVEYDTQMDTNNQHVIRAKKVNIGGYNTQEGTYFDKMMAEVVYILSLGGAFDRSVAPRFKNLPFSCTMKVPETVYADYVNRVNAPEKHSYSEFYEITLTAIDFRVLLNSLEKHIKKGWEIDTAKRCLYKDRYVINLRTRFPVKPQAGLAVKLRDKIKYSREELDEMSWEGITALKEMYQIEKTNRLGVVSDLDKIINGE